MDAMRAMLEEAEGMVDGVLKEKEAHMDLWKQLAILKEENEDKLVHQLVDRQHPATELPATIPDGNINGAFDIIWDYIKQFGWKQDANQFHAPNGMLVFSSKRQVIEYCHKEHPEAFEYCMSLKPSMLSSSIDPLPLDEIKRVSEAVVATLIPNHVYVFNSSSFVEGPIAEYDNIDQCSKNCNVPLVDVKRCLVNSSKRYSKGDYKVSFARVDKKGKQGKKLFLFRKQGEKRKASKSGGSVKKVPKVEKQESASEISLSSASTISDNNTEDIFLFKHVYPWLTKRGWQVVNGSGLVNWIYLRDGFSKKNMGIATRDHFRSHEEVLTYVKDDPVLMNEFIQFWTGEPQSLTSTSISTEELVVVPRTKPFFDGVSFVYLTDDASTPYYETKVSKFGGELKSLGDLDYSIAANEDTFPFDDKFTYLAFPDVVQTSLYISLIARGITVLDIQYISDCIKEERILRWEPYQLPTGLDYSFPRHYLFRYLFSIADDSSDNSVVVELPIERGPKVLDGVLVRVVPGEQSVVAQSIITLVLAAGGTLWNESCRNTPHFIVCDTDNLEVFDKMTVVFSYEFIHWCIAKCRSFHISQVDDFVMNELVIEPSTEKLELDRNLDFFPCGVKSVFPFPEFKSLKWNNGGWFPVGSWIRLEIPNLSTSQIIGEIRKIYWEDNRAWVKFQVLSNTTNPTIPRVKFLDRLDIEVSVTIDCIAGPAIVMNRDNYLDMEKSTVESTTKKRRDGQSTMYAFSE